MWLWDWKRPYIKSKKKYCKHPQNFKDSKFVQSQKLMKVDAQRKSKS